jgi:hypothetical protein
MPEPELTAPSAPAPPQQALSPAGDLQFRKAEFTGDSRGCALCQVPITDTFYQFGSEVVCQNCATQRSELQQPDGTIHFSRALLYGFGAAVAGSILFAAVSLATGYQFSLLSIVVGIMVGKAIKRATRGRGGLKYQVVAVLLTYGAITTSFIPELVRGAASARAERKQSDKNAPQQSQGEPRRTPSFKGTAAAIVLLIGVGLISPVLILASDPAGGLLNALIILFGLLQAWRQTRGSTALLMGPYQAGQT